MDTLLTNPKLIVLTFFKVMVTVLLVLILLFLISISTIFLQHTTSCVFFISILL